MLARACAVVRAPSRGLLARRASSAPDAGPPPPVPVHEGELLLYGASDGGASRRALAGYWLGSGVMPALQLALPAPPAGRSATPPLCFSG